MGRWTARLKFFNFKELNHGVGLSLPPTTPIPLALNTPVQLASIVLKGINKNDRELLEATVGHSLIIGTNLGGNIAAGTNFNYTILFSITRDNSPVYATSDTYTFTTGTVITTPVVTPFILPGGVTTSMIHTETGISGKHTYALFATLTAVTTAGVAAPAATLPTGVVPNIIGPINLSGFVIDENEHHD
ncbi:hypothetical protein SAMN04487897_11220 [Paenibacillus sp. yr247]|uniref:hypothetical protein n=1 Tax=Paenibacillus sp. yr247 TaxID=1761880 RepID=UPI00088CA54E|nr:hypothetical protein [Paenibacillus sp. yr247]SDO32707.1 hypothetical protein SAMN04487897_11220 [Paenibacillus sp. yr247]